MNESPESPLSSRKRDFGALALFAAVGLSVAVTLGATFSSAATGALQALWQQVTANRDAKVTAEFDLQAGAIGELDTVLRQVKQQVASLDGRLTLAGAAAAEGTDIRFAKLDSDIATLSARIATLTAGQAATAEGLNASLTNAGIEIGALRSSIGERDDRQDKDIAELKQRLDRLQDIVSGRDVTSSIRTPRYKRVRQVRRHSGASQSAVAVGIR